MRIRKRLHRIMLRTRSQRSTRGWLQAGQVRIPCALGRSGMKARKREGDGATPLGNHYIRAFLFRQDRLRRMPTGLPLRPIQKAQGWCDDPRSWAYNTPVKIPSPWRHEVLNQDEHLYDIIGILDWNMIGKGRKGLYRGSAIFLHLARDGYAPTEGCIAISATDMRRLLPRLSRWCRIEV